MKLNLEEIFAVIDKMKSVGLTQFVYEDEEMKLKLKHTKEANENVAKEDSREQNIEKQIKKQSVTQVQEPVCAMPKVVEEKELYVVSPMVGTFYVAPAQGAEPFVKVGDEIKVGQVIGIVEAMKLMNEIEAECNGIVEEILVENEQMVEFGQPLVRVR